jgi:hypothetical protein
MASFTPPTLSKEQWLVIRKLAHHGQLIVGPAAIDKVRMGINRFHEALAISVHGATKGEIPCWVTCPDRWSEGQIPPPLQNLGETA